MYTISLTFELTDYPTDFYPKWSVNQDFNVTILDPCALDEQEITPLLIPSLTVINSGTTMLKDEL